MRGYAAVAAGGMILASLYVLSVHRYGAFYQAIGTAIVVIAAVTFLVTVFSAQVRALPVLPVLGGGQVALVILGFAHLQAATVAGAGAGIFDDAASRLDLAARCADAAIVLAALLLARRRPPTVAVATVAAVAALAVALMAVAPAVVPAFGLSQPAAAPVMRGARLVALAVFCLAPFLVGRALRANLVSAATARALFLAVIAKGVAETLAVVADHGVPLAGFFGPVLRLVGYGLVAYPIVARSIIQTQLSLREALDRERALLAQVQEHANTLDAILNASLDRVLMIDAEGRYQFISRSVERDLGVPAHQVRGRTWRDLGLEPLMCEGHARDCALVLATGQALVNEVDVETPEGRRHMEYQVSPVMGEDGVMATVTICRDITARKEMEEELRASLEDNRLLLTEVHHRVKNNLQIVSSILQMEAWRAPDATSRKKFEEACGRIVSLAKVHELLYRENNFARVDFPRYIGVLAEELLCMYGVPRGRINLDMACEDLFLHVDKAVPLGLIVHELITNCIKHAFSKDGGTIRVELCREPEGRVRLSIADDGTGKGAERTPPAGRTSLGKKMIQVLVRQLRGELQEEHDGGTRVTVRIPEDRPAPAESAASPLEA